MNNPTKKSLLYTPSDYDSYYSLKLNLTAWLIIAFIMRPFVVFIASLSNKSDRFGLLNIVYSDHVWALVSAAASIPTIVLLIAWLKRGPHSGRTVRFIWQQGRGLITISLLLNIMLFVTPWLFNAKLSNIALAQLGVCWVLLYVLWRSARMRDTFEDFPVGSTRTMMETHSS